jgi:hypothetical protein
MDYWDYIYQAKQQSPDPREAWQWALSQRNSNPDPQLANAEHYLWNRYYSGKGPIEAMGGLITPFGYYLGKQSGLLGGRSDATIEQLKAGLQGAFEGIGL